MSFVLLGPTGEIRGGESWVLAFRGRIFFNPAECATTALRDQHNRYLVVGRLTRGTLKGSFVSPSVASNLWHYMPRLFYFLLFFVLVRRPFSFSFCLLFFFTPFFLFLPPKIFLNSYFIVLMTKGGSRLSRYRKCHFCILLCHG